ncbi:uncharacterized protein DUF4167 [Palleronia aestuarii]|uniref:Uncharacterized protein DUF4167 n=1 Tax=Palleronia aestuarii TaxID=568105 RepID=A0A2W7NC02_9RHOB|nr:DUF4167 domain-containing protein [Palleronia aestuarii]PZX17510.1 uncharacterized protein DUF4167 [Palleronia aestuarii]
MRSSKSRSRSKSNRNRPSGGGNIVNRVFDSSGPEGKVRGTPQQIIDKYNQLTRDAQLSNDRVAAENFAQHAEHYTRMLAEAQREMDQRREQQDQQQRDQQQRDQQQRDRQQNQGNSAQNDDASIHSSDQRGDDRRRGHQEERAAEEQRDEESPRVEDVQPAAQPDAPAPAAPAAPAAEEQPPKRRRRAAAPKEKPASVENDVIDTGSENDGGLVETPESKPKPRRARKPRAKAGDEPPASGSGESEAVE